MKRSAIMLLLVIIFCVPAKSDAVGNELFGGPQICLAGLITDLAWSEFPQGGQGKIGDFMGMEKENHIFVSPKGKYKCKIVGDRIIWGNYSGRWQDTKDDPLLTYRFELNDIYVRSRFSDGSFTEKKYTPALLNRHTQR